MRDRLIKHFADRLECVSINEDWMVALTFPFLDWHNDHITIVIVDKGDTYLVCGGEMWGDMAEHERRINAFLKSFNSSECLAASPIRYTPEDGFHAYSDYESLPRVVMDMLSCLLKFIGFVEVEMAMRGEGQ